MCAYIRFKCVVYCATSLQIKLYKILALSYEFNSLSNIYNRFLKKNARYLMRIPFLKI
jgi:hypothetical protein